MLIESGSYVLFIFVTFFQVWFLRRVFKKIRKCQCLEVLYWLIWLSSPHSPYWESGWASFFLFSDKYIEDRSVWLIFDSFWYIYCRFSVCMGAFHHRWTHWTISEPWTVSRRYDVVSLASPNCDDRLCMLQWCMSSLFRLIGIIKTAFMMVLWFTSYKPVLIMFRLSCFCMSRFHMKDQCAISCGLILMTAVVGEYRHVVLVIHLDRI